jgi:hypothetical protein
MALPSIPGCGGEWDGFVLGHPSSLNSTNCAVKQTLAGIGHSFGGLLTQILAGPGLAAVSVAIDPAPFRGMLPLPISALKSGSPVLDNPANRNRAVPLTYEQFRYGFVNAVSEEEAHQLYEQFAVPTPGKPLFQAAAANLNPWTEAKVDTHNPERGPLLIISGEKDHTVTWAIATAGTDAAERDASEACWRSAPSCPCWCGSGETFLYTLKAGLRAVAGRPPVRQRRDGRLGAGLTSTRDRANLSPANGAAPALAGSWSRRIVVALPPGSVNVLPIAVPARGTLVMEPMLSTLTTTRTPEPPKCGLDPVPHDGTPPWLHRVSTGRIPGSPCLSLGPVPTGLVLVVELVLAGPTITPRPKPRPHRLGPVQHDAPSYVLRP